MLIHLYFATCPAKYKGNNRIKETQPRIEDLKSMAVNAIHCTWHLSLSLSLSFCVCVCVSVFTPCPPQSYDRANFEKHLAARIGCRTYSLSVGDNPVPRVIVLEKRTHKHAHIPPKKKRELELQQIEPPASLSLSLSRPSGILHHRYIARTAASTGVCLSHALALFPLLLPRISLSHLTAMAVDADVLCCVEQCVLELNDRGRLFIPC